MAQDGGTMDFENWIRILDEDVIQGEYGYERGEFEVFPDRWRPLYDEGITPAQAFKRALDGHEAERRAADEARRENYRRIQAEDAALLGRES